MDKRTPDNLQLLNEAFGQGTMDRIFSGESFTVDGIEFVSGYVPDSRADRFYIVKPPELIERYRRLVSDASGGNIFELGIAEGGSTALLALWAEPRRLVAIDNESEPLAALEEFIVSRSLSDSVRPYYGVDQADRGRLHEIMAEEFGDEPLDLVIDDASHYYDFTVASFEALFPHVRPGGLYVIEDWEADIAMADAVARALQDPTSEYHEATKAAMRKQLAAKSAGEGDPVSVRRTPLARLILQIVLMCGGTTGAVADIAINKSFVAITRGDAELDPQEFRLDTMAPDRVGVLSDL
jgi:predicted O-methyltransferase YrrM